MSTAAVLTPTKNKSGVFGFLNNFTFTQFISPKTVTKDSDWQGHYKDYKKLIENLDLFHLSGKVASKAISKEIDIRSHVANSQVQNPDVAYLTCMDEGVQYISVGRNIIPIAVPGCGILMLEQQEDLRTNILKVLNQYGIKKLVVDSHAKCGAAGIAAKKEFANLSCIHSKDFMDKLTELVADDYAHHLADNLHEDFAELEVTSNYITKLERPDFHNAVGVLVNFDSNTNSSLLIQKLKVPLFALSAYVLDNDILAEDDILAYDIATGGHGFADKFNAENPFIMLFVAKDAEQKKAAINMVSKIEKTCHIQYSFLEA